VRLQLSNRIHAATRGIADQLWMESDLVPIPRLVLPLVALAIFACGLLPTAATAAPAAVNPTALTFMQETVGRTSSPQTVTVNNFEPGAVLISGVSIIGADPGDFSISGGNCAAAILGQSEACGMEVTFAPQAGGTREAILQVAIEGEGAIAVPLSGSGQTKKLTVPGTAGFSTTSVGGSTTEKVLLKNTSEAGINVSEVKIEGADPGDFGIEGNNCVGYIGVAMSCEFSVRFSPAATGPREALLRVISDATPSDYVTGLNGEGAAAEIAFEPTSYDFGLAEVHSGSPRANFTLRNTGTAPVQLSNLEISGPGANEFWIPGSGCRGTMLAAGSTCWIEVQFNANEEGSFSAALSIQAGATTFQAPLSARAERPQVVASPAPLAFGPTPVGSRQIKELTLTNTGHLPVAFFIALVSGGDIGSFHLLEETCTSNVFAGIPRVFEPGESCRAKIAFEPTDAGAEAATVSFFGGGEGALQVPIEGSAVASQPSLSPNSRDFGTVAVGAAGPTQSFALRNESAEAQMIDSATITGADAGEFQVRSDGCSEVELDPGASCTVAVRFAPGSSGPKFATLRLRGPGGATAAGLSGAGAAATAAASAGRGRVQLSLRSHSSPKAAKMTIGRASCKSTEPCTLRVGGLVSGRIATRDGLQPGIRGVAPYRLTLAPGTSAELTTTLPIELRGSADGTRISVAVQWQTGTDRGGGRHSILLSGALRR
jgi:hypothetical protein